jgi:hypothetical protein
VFFVAGRLLTLPGERYLQPVGNPCAETLVALLGRKILAIASAAG